MTFPPCHSRRELEPNGPLAYCAHPRMHIHDQRVHAGVCVICTLRHEPPPETFRPFPPPLSSQAPDALPRGPCRHLGDEIGLRDCPSCQRRVRVKVFACRHPAHAETTIHECLICADHEERQERQGAEW